MVVYFIEGDGKRGVVDVCMDGVFVCFLRWGEGGGNGGSVFVKRRSRGRCRRWRWIREVRKQPTMKN